MAADRVSIVSLGGEAAADRAEELSLACGLRHGKLPVPLRCPTHTATEGAAAFAVPYPTGGGGGLFTTAPRRCPSTSPPRRCCAIAPRAAPAQMHQRLVATPSRDQRLEVRVMLAQARAAGEADPDILGALRGAGRGQAVGHGWSIEHRPNAGGCCLPSTLDWGCDGTVGGPDLGITLWEPPEQAPGLRERREPRRPAVQGCCKQPWN